LKAKFGVVSGLDKPMRRRDFMTGIAGSAAAWPPTARAQQPDRIRRRLTGVLVASADDPEMKARLAGFRQGLETADARPFRGHRTAACSCRPIPIPTSTAISSSRSSPGCVRSGSRWSHMSYGVDFVDMYRQAAS
jgi:hypothetical protein